jgi:phage protein D
MALNDPTALQTATRQPLLRVLNNGQPMPGALSAEVELNNYYTASKFRLEFAASAGVTWDVSPPLLVEVDFSIDGGNSWTPLITCEVDQIDFQLETGLVEMEGRDLSSRLIETRTQATYQNQTSSQVAQALAAEHGLSAQVTPTTTLIGRYYEQDHTRMTLGQFSRPTTEWDLLVFLAQREGMDVFVQGTTLYFQPITPSNSNPFVIQWTPPSPVPRLNAVSVRLQRSLTMAKDIEVWVQSWNSAQSRSFVRKAKGTGKNSNGGTPQRYVYVRPNLSENDAQQLANSLLAELSKHERVVDVEMPGELMLTPRNMVQIQGTGTSFDQAYFIQTITRSLSFEEGFRQSLRLKNSSPRTMTEPT